jgi:TRAP-type uncharacterized transport system fused permease subunit
MALLLEAARRALGLPMVIVSPLLFLIYTFAGPHMPDLIAHKGASLNQGHEHQWLTTEGVFGIALGCRPASSSCSCCSARCWTAGAGNYFIKVGLRAARPHARRPGQGGGGVLGRHRHDLRLVDRQRGDHRHLHHPADEARRLPPDQAGAVEVAASVNGQIMPPVMGAAAFLMVEYVGIPYTEVIKHAFLPALHLYIALFYIVHLEALKAGCRACRGASRGGGSGLMSLR